MNTAVLGIYLIRETGACFKKETLLFLISNEILFVSIV